MPLAAGASVEVVPAFTVRWAGRPESYGLAAYAGVGSYAYQFGATVRSGSTDGSAKVACLTPGAASTDDAAWIS